MNLLYFAIDFDIVFIFLLDWNDPIVVVLTLEINHVYTIYLQETQRIERVNHLRLAVESRKLSLVYFAEGENI